MSSNTTTNTINPWFGITMLLAGGIVGYGISVGYGTADVNQPVKEPAKAPTQQQQQPTANFDALPDFDTKTDYYRGNPDAQLVLIEYSDFQCPYCSRHHITMQQIVKDYGDDVAWVYRHYPLGNHPEAQPAAEAVECAGSLGGNDAFWGLTDKILIDGASSENYLAIASTLGIDMDDFKSCLEDGTFAEKVQKQFADGTNSGVRGTPGTFAIDTDSGDIKYISGAQPIDRIKPVLDALLK